MYNHLPYDILYLEISKLYHFLYNMCNNNYYLTIREQDYFQSQNNTDLCIQHSYQRFEIGVI